MAYKNTGDIYEEKIFNLCEVNGIIAPGSTRAGAESNAPDIKFLHRNRIYKLEVKNNKGPDYGQKRVHFDPSNHQWSWAANDKVTEFYNALNLLNLIDKNFIPIWYQKRIKVAGKYTEKSEYTMSDFKSDQTNFENAKNPVPTDALFKYYSNRNTFYIQIEGSGFYYLEKDIASLNVPQYDGKLSIRFRVKHTGHTKHPPHACQFLGALKQEILPTPSSYNLESNSTQKFPNILKI